MVTDEMMDAIDMMIEICSDEKQALGMKSVREMLGDFDEGWWLNMDQLSECYDWLERYLSCDRKTTYQKKMPLITPGDAGKMIEQLGSGETTQSGDRTTEYFPIACDCTGQKKVWAQLIEEKEGLPLAACGYALHIINEVDDTDCFECTTRKLEVTALEDELALLIYKMQEGKI